MARNVNISAIRSKAMNSPKFTKLAQAEVKSRFERAKAGLLQDFLNDVVTNEIRAGNTAGNSSGTLGGYGNLFSYIGFYEGFDPIAPIEEYLKGFVFNARAVSSRNGNLTFSIKWPSLNTIKNLSRMPWEEGNSWVEGIERGISGFSNYMYDLASGKGRSKAAIQQKSDTGGVSTFSTRKYLPTMLAESQKRFRK
jgi:hypothetical protein